MKQANILKKLRIEKKISQSKLSEFTGISRSTLSKLETGNYNGTVENLAILAKFYGVSIDYITCSNERSLMIDMLIENLVNEGIIDPTKPLTDAAKETILAAVKLKLENFKK